MTYQFDAIFDNGVLKPLEPVVIPDQLRVKVTAEAAQGDPTEKEVLEKQQAALKELWAELAKVPQHQNNDGWSVCDHDQLLYDELQK